MNSRGAQSNKGGGNGGLDLSFNGRIVAFDSLSANLAPGDGNHVFDVFVRDRIAGTTRRVSVATGGGQGNGNSVAPTVSALGRYVTFGSIASNLVANDTNVDWDVFLHDRRSGTTERISVGSGGAQGNGPSTNSDVSRLGRHVAFASTASNLVSSDTNNSNDVFVRDRQIATLARVSIGSAGQQGNGASFEPSISFDGRFVAFVSNASNLVDGDSNARADVFVRDRRLNTTARISVTSAGAQSNDDSSAAAISGNGRYVAFASAANNLVPGSTNDITDVFVHDRVTGVTALISDVDVNKNLGSGEPSISADGRYVAFSTVSDVGGISLKTDLFRVDRQTGTKTVVSVNNRGEEANDQSFFPVVAGDGRDVLFGSRATNLVPDDTNGALDVFVRDR